MIILSMILSTTVKADTIIGTQIGKMLATDIVAKINGNVIPSYNIDNSIVIYTKDLKNYGFDVIWDTEKRETRISRNLSAKIKPLNRLPKSSKRIGEVLGDVLQTDIKTYVNDMLIASFSVNGNTVIYFRDLKTFGDISWDAINKVSSLTLPDEDIVILDSSNQNAPEYKLIGKKGIINVEDVFVGFNKYSNVGSRPISSSLINDIDQFNETICKGTGTSFTDYGDYTLGKEDGSNAESLVCIQRTKGYPSISIRSWGISQEQYQSKHIIAIMNVAAEIMRYYSKSLLDAKAIWSYTDDILRNGKIINFDKYYRFGQTKVKFNKLQDFGIEIVFLSDPRIEKVVFISSGSDHSAAIKDDGTLWTWGKDHNGQLGNGIVSFSEQSIPVRVKSLSDIKMVACGEFYTVALKNNGTVWTWGDNKIGQLGDGTSISKKTPVQVIGLDKVKKIAVGKAHTVALKEDGTVWTWGENFAGQLGNGTNMYSTTPIQVEELSDVKDVEAGVFFTLALKNDGTVWAWGYNKSGQLGDGTTDSKTKPTQVAGLEDVKFIRTGYYHSIAIKDDGTIWGWGHNIYYQLEKSGARIITRAIRLTELTQVEDLALGSFFSFALKSNGSVWAWGGGSDCKIGDYSSKIAAPVEIKEFNKAVNISIGGYISHFLFDPIELSNQIVTGAYVGPDGKVYTTTKTVKNWSYPLSTRLTGLNGFIIVINDDGSVNQWDGIQMRKLWDSFGNLILK